MLSNCVGRIRFEPGRAELRREHAAVGQMPTLETERLRLRPPAASDLPHMQRYSVREDFYRFLPLAVPSEESVADYLNLLLANEKNPDREEFHFAVEPKAVGHIVGTTRIRIRIRDSTSAQADVGYGLDSDYRGRGYATEALRAVLRFGFGELRLHRIWAMADTENEGSWNVLERAGLQREALMLDDVQVRGSWRDSYLYAVLAPF